MCNKMGISKILLYYTVSKQWCTNPISNLIIPLAFLKMDAGGASFHDRSTKTRPCAEPR